MAGEPTNDAAGSFATADVDEAAARLAAILREEDADVLTIYDENGNYGHPDHIQVHVVGVRAARAPVVGDLLLRLLERASVQPLPDAVRLLRAADHRQAVAVVDAGALLLARAEGELGDVVVERDAEKDLCETSPPDVNQAGL